MSRVATLLGFPEGMKDVESLIKLGPYGLGSKRTLDQFIEFTGVDTRNKAIVGDRCKALSWVPFQFDKGKHTSLLFYITIYVLILNTSYYLHYGIPRSLY